MDASELLEPFDRMLADLFSPARVRAIAAGDPGKTEWDAVDASGFLDALLSEEAGGAGLTLAEVLPLFAALGRHAVPLPVGETMLDRAASAQTFDAAAATAVLRAAQIAGAADRVLAMSVAYANERVQFGEPIGRQQAVQQQLAVMAEDVVAVRLAAQLAAARGWPSPEAAAVAKSVASAAAARIANVAHAVHGAIGISAEYDLQLYTSLLHRWRLDSGAETHWNRQLGAAVLGADESALDWVRARLFAG
jgi:alkylation response protein AidB-like acyl-CoA dehydrogenase